MEKEKKNNLFFHTPVHLWQNDATLKGENRICSGIAHRMADYSFSQLIIMNSPGNQQVFIQSVIWRAVCVNNLEAQIQQISLCRYLDSQRLKKISSNTTQKFTISGPQCWRWATWGGVVFTSLLYEKRFISHLLLIWHWQGGLFLSSFPPHTWVFHTVPSFSTSMSFNYALQPIAANRLVSLTRLMKCHLHLDLPRVLKVPQGWKRRAIFCCQHVMYLF